MPKFVIPTRPPPPPGVETEYRYSTRSWLYIERTGEPAVAKVLEVDEWPFMTVERWMIRTFGTCLISALVELIHARDLRLARVLVAEGVDVKSFDLGWYQDVAEPTYEVL